MDGFVWYHAGDVGRVVAELSLEPGTSQSQGWALNHDAMQTPKCKAELYLAVVFKQRQQQICFNNVDTKLISTSILTYQICFNNVDTKFVWTTSFPNLFWRRFQLRFNVDTKLVLTTSAPNSF